MSSWTGGRKKLSSSSLDTGSQGNRVDVGSISLSGSFPSVFSLLRRRGRPRAKALAYLHC